MIDLQAIEAVIGQYERFGWKLEQIVLKSQLDRISSAYPNLPVRIGPIDALWFSRPNQGGQTWELRRLTGLPFALIRFVEAAATHDEREAVIEAAEIDMANREAKPNGEISNGK